MSIEDQPTQQIRLPENSGSTEILSLDDLFDGPQPATTQAPPLPAESPAVEAPPAEPAAVTPPPPAAAPPATPAPPAAPRIGAVPVASAQQTNAGASRPTGGAGEAWRAGLERSRTWLATGDNAVIAATAAIALLLLLAVALF